MRPQLTKGFVCFLQKLSSRFDDLNFGDLFALYVQSIDSGKVPIDDELNVQDATNYLFIRNIQIAFCFMCGVNLVNFNKTKKCAVCAKNIGRVDFGNGEDQPKKDLDH